MELVFVLTTVVTLPFWVLLLVAPDHPLTTRTVHTVWIFVALGALYAVFLAMGTDASAANFATLDGYRELLTSDSALVASWIHYLAVDLFAGAWIARDAAESGIARPIVVLCLLLTLMFAPLGVAAYLLVRAKRTGAAFSTRSRADRPGRPRVCSATGTRRVEHPTLRPCESASPRRVWTGCHSSS